MKPCIVYLAQNSITENERSSRSLLTKSLDLLYQNYNDQFRHDIIIFHEGDFSLQDQEEISAGRKEIIFHEVQFEIPGFLQDDSIPEIWTDGKKGSLSQYRLGYRHMIRFYAIQVYSILKGLGYDWMMRMDDDSFIHSKIDYNLFQFMVDHKFSYGYRVKMLEPVQAAKNYQKALMAYIKTHEVSTTFFKKQKITIRENIRIKQESLQMVLLEKANLRKSKRFMAPFRSFPYWCYYNNFFITDLSFWKQDNVQSFLDYIDQSGGIYKHRWGDVLIQSAAVQLFMKSNQVYQFDDWLYEHATIKENKLLWGGIYGIKGQQHHLEQAFLTKYGRLFTPRSWTKQ